MCKTISMKLYYQLRCKYFFNSYLYLFCVFEDKNAYLLQVVEVSGMVDAATEKYTTLEDKFKATETSLQLKLKELTRGREEVQAELTRYAHYCQYFLFHPVVDILRLPMLAIIL